MCQWLTAVLRQAFRAFSSLGVLFGVYSSHELLQVSYLCWNSIYVWAELAPSSLHFELKFLLIILFMLSYTAHWED